MIKNLFFGQGDLADKGGHVIYLEIEIKIVDILDTAGNSITLYRNGGKHSYFARMSILHSPTNDSIQLE